jgi:hypothetical protein
MRVASSGFGRAANFAYYAASATLAIALAACSGASPNTAPTSAAGSLPAQPIPSPTLSQSRIRDTAAQAYLLASDRANKLQGALNGRYPVPWTLAARRAICDGSADIQHQFVDAMQAITWPDTAAKDARSMLLWLTREEAALRACATSKSKAAWDKAWAKYVDVGKSRKTFTELVRSQIGLPPSSDA